MTSSYFGGFGIGLLPQALQFSANHCKKSIKIEKQKTTKMICTLYVVCMYFVCSFQNYIQTTYGDMYVVCSFENYTQTTYKVHTEPFNFYHIFNNKNR